MQRNEVNYGPIRFEGWSIRRRRQEEQNKGKTENWDGRVAWTRRLSRTEEWTDDDPSNGSRREATQRCEVVAVQWNFVKVQFRVRLSGSCVFA